MICPFVIMKINGSWRMLPSLKISTTCSKVSGWYVEIFLIDWIFLPLMLMFAHQFVSLGIDSSGKPWEWYLLWVSINQGIFCPFAIDQGRVFDEINQINYQNYQASDRQGSDTLLMGNTNIYISWNFPCLVSSLHPYFTFSVYLRLDWSWLQCIVMNTGVSRLACWHRYLVH